MYRSLGFTILLLCLSAKPNVTAAQEAPVWEDAWGEVRSFSEFMTASAASETGGFLFAGRELTGARVAGLLAYVRREGGFLWQHTITPQVGDEVTVRGLLELAPDRYLATFTETRLGEDYGRVFAATLTRGADGGITEDRVELSLPGTVGNVLALALVPETEDYLIAGVSRATALPGEVPVSYLARFSAAGERLGAQTTGLAPFSGASPLTDLVVVGQAAYLSGAVFPLQRAPIDLSDGFEAVSPTPQPFQPLEREMRLFPAADAAAYWVYRTRDSVSVARIGPGGLERLAALNQQSSSGEEVVGVVPGDTDGSIAIFISGFSGVTRYVVGADGEILLTTTASGSSTVEPAYTFTRPSTVAGTQVLGLDTLVAAGRVRSPIAGNAAAALAFDFDESETVATLAQRAAAPVGESPVVSKLLPLANGGVRVITAPGRRPALRDYSRSGQLLRETTLPVGFTRAVPAQFVALGADRFAYRYLVPGPSEFDPSTNHLAIIEADGTVTDSTRYTVDAFDFPAHYLFPRPGGGLRIVIASASSPEEILFSEDAEELSREAIPAYGLSGSRDAIALGGGAVIAIGGNDAQFEPVVRQIDASTGELIAETPFADLGYTNQISWRFQRFFAAADGLLGVQAVTFRLEDLEAARVVLGRDGSVASEERVDVTLDGGYNGVTTGFVSPEVEAYLFGASLAEVDDEGLPFFSSVLYRADAGAAGGRREVYAPSRFGFAAGAYLEHDGRTYVAGSTGERGLTGQSFLLAFDGVLSPTAAPEASLGESLTAYPNPAAAGTLLRFSDSKTLHVGATLTDINGRTVATLTVEAGAVRLPDVPPGLYLLRATIDGEPRIGRIIVQ